MAESAEARFLVPIQIRYDGLDAQAHEMDMAMLGESLQGAARLIAVAAHIAVTAEYTNRTPNMQFRVSTTGPEAGCITIAAILHFAANAAPAFFYLPPPDIVEKIVNYILSSLAARPKNERELEIIADLVQGLRDANQATAQLGLEGIAATRDVSRDAIQALREAAQDQRPAARHLVAPIGQTAAQVVIGKPEEAFVVDIAAREAIDFEPAEEIRDATEYRVKLTELDLKTGTGKAEVEGFDPAKRYTCGIADPVVRNAQSAYSNALNDQRWLRVLAKPHFHDNDLHKLTVLDTIKS